MIIGFQQGGVFTPPFVVYQPSAPVPITSEKASSKKEDKKDSGVELKEIFGLIRELEGLPGDEDVAFGALKKLFDSIEYKINNPELQYMGSTSSISSDYLKIIRIIDDIKGQAKAYTEALNTATANNNLSEAAVDSHGRIMVMNEQGFDWVTPEEYYEDRESEQYQIVTNADLLDFRRKGVGGLAFNNSVFNTVANGMGSKQITDLIQEAINGLGKLSSNAPISGYIGVTAGQLINGLDSYIAAVKKSDGVYQDVEDLYKANLLTENQAEQAEQALKYIYFTLPNSAKATLKLKSGVGTDLGALELISSLIASKHSKTYKLDISLEGGPTKEIAEIDKDESKMKNTFLIDLIKNEGGSEMGFIFDVGNGIVLRANGRMHSGIVDATNYETLGSGSFEEIFLKSGMQNIINDQADITFGDQKISRAQFKKLIYDNTGVLRTNLPIKNDGTVDIEILDRYKQAEDDLKLTNKTREDYLKIYKKHNIEFLLMPNGEKMESKFWPFIVMEASTTSENGIKKSEYIREVEDPSEDDINMVEGSLSDKENPYVIDEFNLLNPADWFNNYDIYYKGLVFIPVNPNVVSALHGSGQEIDYEEARAQDEKYSNFNKMIRQQNNSSSILNNN